MRVWLTIAPLSFVLQLPVGCGQVNELSPALLVEGEAAYRAKQYETAVQRLSAFLAEAKDSPDAARALYVRGMCHALSGRRPQAYADLEAAARGADSETGWRANAVLGVLHFEDERWEAGAQALGRATSKMPARPPRDALLYRQGLCYERTGRWSEALDVYRRVLAASPAGVYAENAARRLRLKADHFAVQCGVFEHTSGADRLVAQLRQAGFPAAVRQETRGGQQYYVVLVGRYASYPAAKESLTRVRAHVPGAVLWP